MHSCPAAQSGDGPGWVAIHGFPMPLAPLPVDEVDATVVDTVVVATVVRPVLDVVAAAPPGPLEEDTLLEQLVARTKAAARAARRITVDRRSIAREIRGALLPIQQRRTAQIV